MTLIRHCIVDTNTNTVVNIIEYDSVQTGIPPGLDSTLICVQNDVNNIGDIYNNGVFTAIPKSVVELNFPTPKSA